MGQEGLYQQHQQPGERAFIVSARLKAERYDGNDLDIISGDIADFATTFLLNKQPTVFLLAKH